MQVDKTEPVPQSDDMPPICVALRRVVEEAGLSQKAFGELLNEKQQTVSAWLRRREPKLDDLARIEAALDLKPGYIFRAAGYVKDPSTVRDAIVGDTRLTQQWRDIVLVVYDSSVAQSDRERNSVPTVDNTRTS